MRLSQMDLPIKGKWISKEDPKYIVLITSDKFIEIYDSDTIYSGHYIKSHESCDSNYYKGTAKPEFLKIADGRCFEITGINRSTLAYRHSTSARLHVFKKGDHR